MKTAYHFFLRHAGYSYDPKTETPMQGRIKNAQTLARAEALFMRACRDCDISIEWEDDPHGWQDFHSDQRMGYSEGDAPGSIESAAILRRDDSGRVHCLASLGGIWDADSNYRRVIRAELAQECAAELTELLGA